MNASGAVQILRDAEGIMSTVRTELKRVTEQGAHITRAQLHELVGKLEGAEQQVSGLREAIEGPKSGPVATAEPEGQGEGGDPADEAANVGGAPVGSGPELTDTNNDTGDGPDNE